MKKILAVSGGVDSMVMLEIFWRKYKADEFCVATFDHGTRETSRDDAEFVVRTCHERGIEVFSSRTELGEKASEEKARSARYEFLRKIAFEKRGEIYTAHHLDDLVETVAINFLRGTGVRGLAPFSSLGIRRPMLDGMLEPAELQLEVFDKRSILRLADRWGVKYRQDPTNTTSDYLRNRVREATMNLSLDMKLNIYRMWNRQRATVREIDDIVESILPEDLHFMRADFAEMDKSVALEILRGALIRAGVSATTPQITDFYDAILSYVPGKNFNLPEDKLVRLNKKDFML